VTEGLEEIHDAKQHKHTCSREVFTVSFASKSEAAIISLVRIGMVDVAPAVLNRKEGGNV